MNVRTQHSRKIVFSSHLVSDLRRISRRRVYAKWNKWMCRGKLLFSHIAIFHFFYCRVHNFGRVICLTAAGLTPAKTWDNPWPGFSLWMMQFCFLGLALWRRDRLAKGYGGCGFLENVCILHWVVIGCFVYLIFGLKLLWKLLNSWLT